MMTTRMRINRKRCWNGDYIYFVHIQKLETKWFQSTFVLIVVICANHFSPYNHEINLGNWPKNTISKYQREQIVLRYVSGCLKNTLAPERL